MMNYVQIMVELDETGHRVLHVWLIEDGDERVAWVCSLSGLNEAIRYGMELASAHKIDFRHEIIINL